MHSDDSHRKSHRLFDGRVDKDQLVEGRFGPLTVVSFENIITLFSEPLDKVCSIWRVEQVKEGVCYCL
jgi:hypothetical protein